MKKLITLLLVLALVSLVQAAPTVHDTPDGNITLSKYFSKFQVLDFDSLLGNTAADTGKAFPLNNFGLDQPFPDAVDYWFGVTSSDGDTVKYLDSLIYEFDVSIASDSTNLSERALSWIPIWDNSDNDTIYVGPDLNNLPTATYTSYGVYTPSAADLAIMAGATHGRFIICKTGDGSATDTVRVQIFQIERYTGWKDN